jgi:hypothetical protein
MGGVVDLIGINNGASQHLFDGIDDQPFGMIQRSGIPRGDKQDFESATLRLARRQCRYLPPSHNQKLLVVLSLNENDARIL